MRLLRVHAPHLPTHLPARLRLDGDEATHLTRVLRVRPGQEVELFDGQGAAVLARVVEADRRAVELECHAPGRADPTLPFALWLAVSPPKGKREHHLLEGLTELGVTGHWPLLLRRTEARPARPEEQLRWSLEAAKQCGRNRPLVAAPPLDLPALLAEAPRHALCLLADTVEAAPLREVLARPRPASVLVAVGPEGGFDPAERDALRAAGFAPARLGPTVLRIETAAVALAAACVSAWS